MPGAWISPRQFLFTRMSLRPAAPLKKMVETLEATHFLHCDASHRNRSGWAALFVSKAIVLSWTKRSLYPLDPGRRFARRDQRRGLGDVSSRGSHPGLLIDRNAVDVRTTFFNKAVPRRNTLVHRQDVALHLLELSAVRDRRAARDKVFVFRCFGSFQELVKCGELPVFHT
jgi:hypothetical protein